jgi:hypothetical protein
MGAYLKAKKKHYSGIFEPMGKTQDLGCIHYQENVPGMTQLLVAPNGFMVLVRCRGMGAHE